MHLHQGKNMATIAYQHHERIAQHQQLASTTNYHQKRITQH